LEIPLEQRALVSLRLDQRHVDYSYVLTIWMDTNPLRMPLPSMGRPPFPSLFGLTVPSRETTRQR